MAGLRRAAAHVDDRNRTCGCGHFPVYSHTARVMNDRPGRRRSRLLSSAKRTLSRTCRYVCVVPGTDIRAADAESGSNRFADAPEERKRPFRDTADIAAPCLMAEPQTERHTHHVIESGAIDSARAVFLVLGALCRKPRSDLGLHFGPTGSWAGGRSRRQNRAPAESGE